MTHEPKIVYVTSGLSTHVYLQQLYVRPLSYAYALPLERCSCVLYYYTKSVLNALFATAEIFVLYINIFRWTSVPKFMKIDQKLREELAMQSA